MKKIVDFKLVQEFKALQKKQKVIFSMLAAVLVLCIILAAVFSCSPKYSSVKLDFGQEGTGLQFLNSSGKSGKISSGEYGYFAFTEEQQNQLIQFYKNNRNIMLSLTVDFEGAGKNLEELKSSSKIFSLGFLYDYDFDEEKNVKNNSLRIVSSVMISDFVKQEKSSGQIAFSLPKGLKAAELPSGFAVYSDYPVKVKSAAFCESVIGFDFSREIPFAGCSSNGGKLNFASRQFDFSGASFVFPKQNSSSSIMPVIEVGFIGAEDYGTLENPLKVKMNAGGESYTFYRFRKINEHLLQTSLMENPFSDISFGENREQVVKCVMKPNSQNLISEKTIVPLKTDLGIIFNSSSVNWRNSDYELYEWEEFPGVLFFDMKDYDIQSKFLRRIAFFAEKKGFIGKILTDAELGNLHGYNAHDYNVKTLADFFTKAEPKNVLNSSELLLKQILLTNGLIVESENGYEPGRGALISISQESAGYNRTNFTAHEAFHTIFFNDESFRNATSAAYYTFDPVSLKFLIEYWQSQPGLSYDPADEYLMNNEFMAYIMQQPLNRIAQYFVHTAERGSVQKAIPELADYVIKTKGQTFEDVGHFFDSFAFDNYGLACGRVHLVYR